jgi:5-methylcytosine-specific restriction endonuclease McrBC GTP-binding regulatory subunit McrB
MYFDRVDGIFMKFVDEARKNYENSQKTKEVIEKEMSTQEAFSKFLSDVELGTTPFYTIKNNEFFITNVYEHKINIFIPKNLIHNKMSLKTDWLFKLVESQEKIEKTIDVDNFFKRKTPYQDSSYYCTLCKEIRKYKQKTTKTITNRIIQKKYIFIIDEINRGEISKIFGELFFSIDPGYRGKAGEISTQYANLHDDPEKKFYIPENVYIIGTMNDIDRSVDSFDFAMRRRFRFIEIKADACLEMLDDLNDEELKEEAIRRMTALNDEIAKTEELNEDYQIGAAYFLKLKTLSFDQLWTDYLQPLLKEYIQGMYDEANIMKRFEKAYGYEKPNNENDYESTENQG